MNGSLSPQHLARDFGASSAAAREGIAALYAALTSGSQPLAHAAQTQWEMLVGNAFGQIVDRSGRAAHSLARCYRIPAGELEPGALLLAVHTYYAILVKLLLWHVAADALGLPAPGQRFVEASGGKRLRGELNRWEQGAVWPRPELFALFAPDPFTWHLSAWSEALERWLRNLAAQVHGYDVRAFRGNDGGACDLFKELYPALFPQKLRHTLGQYYTPDWLTQHLLDEIGYSGQPGKRLLDPSCGSGTFLVAAINRIRTARTDLGHAELYAEILANVVGFDLDPLATATARANYLIAISDLLPTAGRLETPVHLRDSILSSEPGDAATGPAFDYVVGNPPWIAWDHLPESYREATKPLWQQYGLFSLSGTAARHGGGKKDLSMLMLYVAADRYLKHGGRLGLVMTQTPLQSKGAGDGFRRFRLGQSGPWLRVLEVHDMADFQPFPGAANWTCTLFLEKGSPTVYPVPYVKWSAGSTTPSECGAVGGGLSQFSSDENGTVPLGSTRSDRWEFRQRRYLAQPIDPDRPNSPWLVRPKGLGKTLRRLVGPSDYQAHLGANSGGANGVYWLRVLGPADGGVRIQNGVGRAKRDVETVEDVVESELVYPLLRWGDVARYRAQGPAYVLLTQDVATRHGIDAATLQQKYPHASRYLQRFQTILESRAAYRRYQQDAAFWSMYDVGPYTVAPIKVVWRRMDRRINAAVVGPAQDPWLGLRPVIPQETCVLIPADTLDEAHYLCALLNSSVVNYLVRAHSVRGGKGFGTPSILDFLRLRRFDPTDERHAQLAVCSRQAHDRAERGQDYGDLQQRIDRLAAQLRELTDEELEAIEREERGA